MEMLYSGAYDLSRKNRTHTGARAERARARARARARMRAWSISVVRRDPLPMPGAARVDDDDISRGA